MRKLFNRDAMSEYSKTGRFIELDLLRGVAILAMILGHLLWDLDYYGIAALDDSVYSFFQIIAPNLFFLLVGMCIVVSFKKRQTKGFNDLNEYYKHLFTRGMKIFALGVVLTVITLIFIPDKPILFGVLHCIGISIILSIPFLKYRQYTIFFSVIFIILGMLVSNIVINNPTIFHLALGLHQKGIWGYTVDYFPLLPWFGICLLGLVVGDLLYHGDSRRFYFPDLSVYRPAKIFSWFGQQSLMIYLLHQPLIAAVIILYSHL